MNLSVAFTVINKRRTTIFTDNIMMNRIFTWTATGAATLFLASCVGGAFELGDSAAPPANVRAVAGDGSVTLTWDSTPGAEYWVFAAPGNDVTTENWDHLGGLAQPHVTSPYVVANLTNGKTYAFTVNARTQGGPGGPGSPVVVATPRPAGASWTVESALGGGRLNGAAFGQVFVAVGDQGALYTSPDFSATNPAQWTAVSQPAGQRNLQAALYGCDISYQCNYLVVGAQGTILRSTDAYASSWTQPASPSGNDLLALASNGLGAYMAVGRGGTILVSTDGQTWTARSSGTAQDLLAVTYGDGRWIAVGRAGTVLSSQDTLTWTALASGSSEDLHGITAVSSVDDQAIPVVMFVAVGDHGQLLRSTDAGAHWTQGQLANGALDLKAISFGSQFVVVGSQGAIYTSDDGKTWVQQNSGVSSDLLAIAHSSASIAVVGAQGTSLTAK